MGPRSTRQAVAPPSEGIPTATEGAGGDEGAADTGAEAATDGTRDADAGADGSAGPPFPGDPLHAVTTAKTSHHGARTLLLYYA
jgi:hypothetical protein